MLCEVPFPCKPEQLAEGVLSDTLGAWLSIPSAHLLTAPRVQAAVCNHPVHLGLPLLMPEQRRKSVERKQTLHCPAHAAVRVPTVTGCTVSLGFHLLYFLIG